MPSTDLASKAADNVEPIFSATDYFLGIAQRIAASRDNTRVFLPDQGEVTLYPGLKEYYANIPDIASFCQAPAGQFEIIPLNETYPPTPGSGKHIGELLWHAAFHASQGRLATGLSKYDVVQFHHWPNLTRLPASPNTMRICALLTRHPTTIMLVHRQLGIGKDEVYRIYSAAHCAGIASKISCSPQAVEPVIPELPEPEHQRGLLRALLAKISGL